MEGGHPYHAPPCPPARTLGPASPGHDLPGHIPSTCHSSTSDRPFPEDVVTASLCRANSCDGFSERGFVMVAFQLSLAHTEKDSVACGRAIQVPWEVPPILLFPGGCLCPLTSLCGACRAQNKGPTSQVLRSLDAFDQTKEYLF